MAPVLLISTDFDGTLVEHGAPAPFSPLLIEVLSALRRRGVQWAINTGRSLNWLEDGMREFDFRLRPDFALTTEREIFRMTNDGLGWSAVGDWNQRSEEKHDALYRDAAPAFAEIARFVRTETRAEMRFEVEVRPGLRPANAPTGIVARDSAELSRIVDFIDQARVGVPALSYQRNTIFLRFCHADYDKGATLAALGGELELGRESIFAIGDHENDLPMLTGTVAAHVACPANSIRSVKAVVQAAGGYVAAAGFSLGVIEALRYYCANLGD